MKQLISLFLGGILLAGVSIAYTPSNADIQAINQLNTQLDILTSGNMQGKANLYIQLKVLQEQFSGHEKLVHYLNSMDGFLMSQINTEKAKAKGTSKTFKQTFVDTYSGDISVDITHPDNCTGRYNTMDSLSFAYNLPTALTLSIRYRENTCGYNLPNNKNGPFQIISKDYGTGTITPGIFMTTLKDFFDFAHHKINRYEGANKASSNPEYNIDLSYNTFDMTGLVKFSALYNSLSGNTVYGHILPKNPNYAWDGYGAEFSGATRYGVIPKFIKLLDWELKNTY